MKRLFAILMFFALILSSCGNTETIDNSNDTAQITSIEKMTKIDGVISVTKLTEFCTSAESAYKLDFEVDGIKRYAEIALPNDYAEESYPSVLYFPDIGYGVDYLIDNFAKKDVIVIRTFSRGSKENEGTKDFCGEDFADAVKLLDICKNCEFLSSGGIFTAGAVTGATFALKLAAEYPDIIAGCAVVDPICDYESFAEERGESIKSMFLSAIGCSEDELSAELAKRSPKNFYQNIKAPVLLFCYENSPIIANSHTEMLKDLLDDNGCATEIQYLTPASSDFNGTAFMKLIPWINNISKASK